MRDGTGNRNGEMQELPGELLENLKFRGSLWQAAHLTVTVSVFARSDSPSALISAEESNIGDVLCCLESWDTI